MGNDEKQISWCKANKHFTKATVWKGCTYVQKDKNQFGESFDSSPDNEHTFLESCFHGEPIVYVQTIEEMSKLINLYRVPKK